MAERISLPLLVALVGFFIGFVLVVPLGCTVSESAHVTRPGGTTTISSAGTSCGNAIGVDYSGGRNYEPPFLPAVGAGLLLALLSGLLAYFPLQDRQQRVTSSTLGWIGVTLHVAWTLFLGGLGLFSEGSLDPQWRTALIFVCLAGVPAPLAIWGIKHRPALLLTAGILCLPLSLISLAGATLPLLLPGALYMTAYARS